MNVALFLVVGFLLTTCTVAFAAVPNALKTHPVYRNDKAVTYNGKKPAESNEGDEVSITNNVALATEYDLTGMQSIDTNDAPTDTLSNGHSLLPGQQLLSADGRWKLVYQTDGNLAAYATLDGSVVWNVGKVTPSPGFAVMQTDGNLCLYTADRNGYYCTSTNGKGTGPYYRLVMQNDRNICIYDSFGKFIWGSSTGPAAS